MNKCQNIECTTETSNPKFCSRSCSAKVSNSARWENGINPLWRGLCNLCGIKCSSSRKYCSDDCRKAARINASSVISGQTKRCNLCKEIKDIGLFGVNKNTSDGLMYQCKECNRNRVKEFQRKNGLSKKLPQYRRHGISKNEYDALIEKQNESCAVCNIKFKEDDATAIDHDHSCCEGAYSCGACVRGILHRRCNQGLGLFEDNIDFLYGAIKYLSKRVRVAEGTTFTQ